MKNSIFIITRRLGMTSLLLITVLIAATTLRAQEPAGAEPPPPPPLPGSQPGTIAGRIGTTNEGMFRGATITLTNEQSKEKRTTTVDANKEFFFKDLAEAPHTIRVDSDGFAPAERRSINPGQGPQDFQIRLVMLWEPLYPAFRWVFESRVGSVVRDSTWAFAYLEVFHLLGITMLLGSVVALGMRLANIAMKSLPVAEVAKEIRPFMIIGLAVALLSGILMFAAEAEKLFLSGPFEWKIGAFALANIFQFTAVSWLAHRREGSSLALGKLAALLSVVLWYFVAWQGRAIAFF
jgi:hypothetical protein